MNMSKIDLNFQFLFTFINLVEAKSYTKTAELLGMTQPGVSQHIKWLEEYFKVKLILKIPKSKSFELTNEGIKVYQYGKEIIKNHSFLKESLEKDDELSGVLNLASPGSFGIKAYSFVLKYCTKYKGIKPHFYYSPNDSIEKAIIQNELNGGFMSTKPKSSAVKAIEIDQEELFLLVPKDFKYTGFRSLEKIGLINHPDAEFMVNKLFELNYKDSYQSFNELKISGANNQITRILEPVALGLGYTILPEFAATESISKNKVKKVKLKKTHKNPIYFVYKKNKNLPNRYKKFINEFSKKKIFIF